MLLPYVDDVSTIPMDQRDPIDEIETLQCEMKRFFLIWNAKLSLCKEKNTLSLSCYPLHHMSNACSWEKNKCYQMDSKNCVKCTVKYLKTEESWFYANDPDFFLLVNFQDKDYAKVQFVESLMNVEVFLDRADPRRLVFITKDQNSLEIVFSDTQKSLLAHNEINCNKLACRERYIMLMSKLLDQLSNCN